MSTTQHTSKIVSIPAAYPASVKFGPLNDRLDEAVERSRVNEDFLWSILAGLDKQGGGSAPHRLTLIRLTELTLWLAGDCADAGELAMAGDLMINPRRKLLFIKGRLTPIALDRHTRLTEQAARGDRPVKGPSIG